MKDIYIEDGYEYSTLEKIISWSMPVSFFFMQYSSIIGTVNLTITSFFALLCIIKYKGNDLGKLFLPFMIYTGILVLRTFINIFISDGGSLSQGFRIVFQYIILALSIQIVAKHIDINRMYKSWCLIAMIICIAVLWQSILIYVLHQNVYPIKLLPFSESTNWSVATNRPTVFFTEPAVVVALLTPVIFMSLLRKRIKFAIFLSACSLLTASTTSIIAVLILWIFYIVSSDLPRSKKISFIVLFILSLSGVLSLSLFSTATDKLLLETSGNSSNVFGRMISGWLVFQHLDISMKLFGIPSFDISNYLHNHSEFFPYLSQVRTASGSAYFFNTAQRIFLTTGIIGAIFYANMLIKIIKGTSKKVLPYVIYVIVIMFFASNFYMSNFFMMQFTVIFAYMEYDNRREDYEIINV